MKIFYKPCRTGQVGEVIIIKYYRGTIEQRLCSITHFIDLTEVSINSILTNHKNDVLLDGNSAIYRQCLNS